MDEELEKKPELTSDSDNYADFLRSYVSYENEYSEEKALNKAYESCLEEGCSSLPFGSND